MRLLSYSALFFAVATLATAHPSRPAHADEPARLSAQIYTKNERLLARKVLPANGIEIKLTALSTDGGVLTKAPGKQFGALHVSAVANGRRYQGRYSVAEINKGVDFFIEHDPSLTDVLILKSKKVTGEGGTANLIYRGQDLKKHAVALQLKKDGAGWSFRNGAGAVINRIELEVDLDTVSPPGEWELAVKKYEVLNVQ